MHSSLKLGPMSWHDSNDVISFEYLDQNEYTKPVYGMLSSLPVVWLQIFFQIQYFIPDPIKNDVKYQARAQPFLVFGLLTTGLAIGHVNAM